jgi:hypothetical protein
MYYLSQTWQFVPVIPATQEAEFRKLTIPAQLG